MTASLVLADLCALSRRRWLQTIVALGLAVVVAVAVVAAGEDGAEQATDLRAGAASLLLLGGLVLAVGLGGTAVNRDADSGFLGLLVASGAERTRVGAARAASRLVALAAVLALWGVALQVASAAVGRGLDGPLAVHTLAVSVALALALLVAAAMSTVFAPVVAGVVGVVAYVSAQALVNLKAAVDQGAIGDEVGPFVDVAYHVLPRVVSSPMIVDLQLRGEAGPAAPRVEINDAIVVVHAAGSGTVVWTLAWCVLLALLVVAGVRRRALT